MASKESAAVKELYQSWTAARQRGERADIERWGDLTAEPGGVDYIETDAGGVLALWESRRAPLATGCCASTQAASGQRDLAHMSSHADLIARPGPYRQLWTQHVIVAGQG